MKKTFLLLLLLLPVFGFSQLNTNKVISSANSAPYNNLQNALTYLKNNNGISAPVTLFLDNNESVSTTILIESIPGTSSTNTLTIKPNTNRNVTISGTNPNGWTGLSSVIKFSGAKNIIIDGSNTPNGATKNLTIQNNNTVDYASTSVVWVASNGSIGNNDITIKNTSVKYNVRNQPGLWLIGIFSGNGNAIDTNPATAANSNLKFTNNEFLNVREGIIVNSSTTESLKSTNITIENNNFGNLDSNYAPTQGVYILNSKTVQIANNQFVGLANNSTSTQKFLNAVLLSGVNGFTITKNTINNLKTNHSGATTNAGITVNGASSNGLISKNTISDIRRSSGGAISGLILESSVSSNNIEASNNLIYNVSSNGENNDTSGGHGINIRSGNGYKIYFNTVVMNSQENTTASNAALYLTGGSGIDIKNNILFNTNQTAGRRYAIYSTIASGNFTSDYNDLISQDYVGYIGGSNRTSIADWRTATTKDANSKNIAPVFIDSNLRLNQTHANNISLVGQQVSPAITTDRFDVTRTTPTMGSEEIQRCVAQGDQTTFGNGQWIGYVYSNYSNYNSTPAVGNTNYQGFVTEPAIFDQNIPNGTAFRGSIATNLCDAPTTQYFVRYKMKMTLTAGTYNFTVGGDDGYRLKIDGVAVTTINNWGEHSYTTSSVLKVMTAAEHTFELEYFNGPNLAHVSFSYGKVQGDPTVFGNNVWNVYGFNSTNVDFNNLATQASYSGYYVQGTLGVNTQDLANNGYVRTGAPSESAGWNGAPINASAYTITHKRKGFPCGTYQLVMDNWDDDAVIYLDENPVAIWSQNGYSGGHPAADRQVGTFKLGPDSKLEVRLKQTGGDGNLKLSITNIPVTYNNGWSSDPTNSAVVINSDFTVSNDLTVCSCTVKAGKKVTINSGKALNVIENVTVETGGNIYVKNNGSLVQIKDYATFTGDVNSFTMERNTTSMILYDFTYWGSPVAAQNLKTFSPKTLADKYFSFNGTNWVVEAPTTTSMTPGRGYIIRAPQAWNNTITNGGYSSNSNPGNTTPANANGTFAGGVFQGVFIGKANAGDITVPLLGSAGSSNLFGNPYASPISTEEFMNANVGKTDGNFYFWTHKTPISRNPDTSGHYNYADSDYAMINKTGGTATSPIAAKPSANVAAGQGFFVNTKAANTNIVFKNSMRVQGGGNNGEFYRTASNTQNDKYWISISNGTAYNEFLVGYMEGATNAMEDNFDGISYSAGAAMLYTVIDGNKLAIQGRQYPFNNTDAVPVGYKVTAAGQFTISINKKEGTFENGQAIYLYDTTTNEYHDLTAGDFVFNSAAGTFDSRFEMRYTNETLGVDTPVVSNSDIVVYKSGNQISVKAKNFTIDGVQVYDITGKSLYAKKGINNSEFSTASLNATTQVLVVKVTLDNNQTISKKVIMN